MANEQDSLANICSLGYININSYMKLSHSSYAIVPHKFVDAVTTPCAERFSMTSVEANCSSNKQDITRETDLMEFKPFK